MNPQQLIDSYSALASLTGQMRIAADRGEWDSLIELEQDFSQQLNKIRIAGDDVTLSDTARQQLIQQITNILEEDARIRTLSEGWMEQLKNAMHSNKQEQRLNQTYGAI